MFVSIVLHDVDSRYEPEHRLRHKTKTVVKIVIGDKDRNKGNHGHAKFSIKMVFVRTTEP